MRWSGPRRVDRDARLVAVWSCLANSESASRAHAERKLHGLQRQLALSGPLHPVGRAPARLSANVVFDHASGILRGDFGDWGDRSHRAPLHTNLADWTG